MTQERSSESRNLTTPLVLLLGSFFFLGAILLCNVATGLISGLGSLMLVNSLQANPVVNNRLLFGALVGVGGIALIWLGAGAAYGVARVRRIELKIGAAIGLFIGVPFVLIGIFAVPLLIGWFSAVLVVPDWKSLNPVPDRAMEIIDSDTSIVYVRSATGKIYGCRMPALTECWHEASEPLALPLRHRRIPVKDTFNPPSNAVSTLGVAYDVIPEAGIEVYFAVLPDGTVWWWRHESPHALYSLFGWLMAPVVGLLILLFFTPIYLGALILWLSRTKPRRAAIST